VARVVVAPTAIDDLDGLILSRHLPRNTRARVKARLNQLADFPEGGSELEGRWKGFRFVLGPWSWMLIVYIFDEEADQVSVVTIQDSRTARSATSER
jgi:mRNA-degrading endonuclease RelE of RelBE toxin-antitoxin system